ncbi:hypothetical protein BH11PLA2_BH11PLA2_44970 [soil metagenome]
MAPDTKTEITPRIVGWTVVYGLNLIVPIMFGTIVCRNGGLGGMIAGIFAFYFAVTYFVIRFPRFGTAATNGSFLFAFSQFFAFLQMMAGTLALGIWETVTGNNGGLGGNNSNPVLAEVGGFACTIMTGQPLFAIAVGLGYIINSIVTGISGRRLDPTAYDDE